MAVRPLWPGSSFHCSVAMRSATSRLTAHETQNDQGLTALLQGKNKTQVGKMMFIGKKEHLAVVLLTSKHASRWSSENKVLFLI